MKKCFLILLICFTACVISHAQVSLKRKAPKEVTPIIVDNIKYTAPTNQLGCVIAKDVTTDTLIWRKQVYTIQYNKDLEKDVQDVFIDSLFAKGKNLIIRTERGKVYSIQIQ